MLVRQGQYYNFNPKNIDNLKIWLDASNANNVAQAGGLVSKMIDISGNGNNFSQTTGSLMPSFVSDSQNSLSTVKFDNAHCLISAYPYNFSTIAPFTIFYAVKFFTLASTDQFSSISRVDLANTATWIMYYTGSNSVYSTLTRDTKFNVYGIKFDTDLSVKFFKKRSTSSHTALSAGTEATSARAIGASYSNSSTTRFSQVNVGELLFYNQALNDSQATQIIDYLTQKWRSY